MQKDIRKCYFENRTIEKNLNDLNKYMEMMSAMNFDLPMHKAVVLHAAHSKKPPFNYL